MKNSANHFFIQCKYIKIFLSVLLSIIFLHGIVFSQADENYRSKFHFELGSNIWGNILSVGYDYSFSKHIYAGIGLNKGYFQYNIASDGNFLTFENIPGHNNIVSIDFKNTIDLKLGYNRKPHTGMNFFNNFEAGVSFMHFTFKDQYVDDHAYLWKGSKDYNLCSFLSAVSILDYYPEFEKHLSFGFGFKSWLTLTKSPETLVYENIKGQSYQNYLIYNGNSNIYWFYPELFFRINYSL